MSRPTPRGNDLLAALPEADYERLSPSLELVALPLGRAVYESGERLDYVYFPTDCIVSLLSVTHDGSSAELALAGNEGLVGIASFMGGETTSSRAVVQNAGHAYRVPSAVIRREFDRGGALQLLLLRYTQALITQMAQTAVCNRHHSLEQQLCRWLLLSLDRLPSNTLEMTEELIANMLGVPQTGVDAAVRRLQADGLIRYRRGLDHGARAPRARAARVRMLRGGQGRVRPPAAVARPRRGAATLRIHRPEHGGNRRGVGGVRAHAASRRRDHELPSRCATTPRRS